MIAPVLSLLLLAGVPPPLTCPGGTEHRGAAPMEGFEEWCEVQGPAGTPLREGPARTYYDDGNTWTEAHYHEGQLHGPFFERYRNGSLARQGSYEMGKRDGVWRSFYSDGTREEESSWRAGLKDGRFASYWPNGAAKQVGQHCLGVQCGVWRAFDDGGRELGVVEYGGSWRERP